MSMSSECLSKKWWLMGWCSHILYISLCCSFMFHHVHFSIYVISTLCLWSSCGKHTCFVLPQTQSDLCVSSAYTTCWHFYKVCLIPCTCFWPDLHRGSGLGVTSEKLAKPETSVRDCVLTLVSLKPLDVFEETSDIFSCVHSDQSSDYDLKHYLILILTTWFLGLNVTSMASSQHTIENWTHRGVKLWCTEM